MRTRLSVGGASIAAVASDDPLATFAVLNSQGELRRSTRRKASRPRRRSCPPSSTSSVQGERVLLSDATLSGDSAIDFSQDPIVRSRRPVRSCVCR